MAATRRVFVPDRCRICSLSEHLIIGDGAVVCRPCLMTLTEIADDPFCTSQRQRDELRRDHAAWLALTETANGTPAWTWFR